MKQINHLASLALCAALAACGGGSNDTDHTTAVRYCPAGSTCPAAAGAHRYLVRDADGAIVGQAVAPAGWTSDETRAQLLRTGDIAATDDVVFTGVQS